MLNETNITYETYYSICHSYQTGSLQCSTAKIGIAQNWYCVNYDGTTPLLLNATPINFQYTFTGNTNTKLDFNIDLYSNDHLDTLNDLKNTYFLTLRGTIKQRLSEDREVILNNGGCVTYKSNIPIHISGYDLADYCQTQLQTYYNDSTITFSPSLIIDYGVIAFNEYQYNQTLNAQYNKGVTDTNVYSGSTSIISNAVSGFADILNHQIMPNVTIGGCLAIPLIIISIATIFKVLK